MPKFAKKPYRAEQNLPINTGSVGTKTYSFVETKSPPNNISMQFLGPKDDLERLVDKGMKDAAWLMRFLQNTGMSSVLNYAEKRINACHCMHEADRQLCLDIIRGHYVRKKK
ncbi:MAG: hypothetical protein WCJ45_09490 [bacterium]